MDWAWRMSETLSVTFCDCASAVHSAIERHMVMRSAAAAVNTIHKSAALKAADLSSEITPAETASTVFFIR